jgi:TPR repeat protein
MEPTMIKLVAGKDTCPAQEQAARDAARDAFVAQCLAAAQDGDCEAYFDLGMAFSTGSDAVGVDLVEAHKWFNLAAVGGQTQAAQCRADVAEDMTAREIAEAQRRAREWLRASPSTRVA